LALAAHGPIAVPEADRRTCTDEDQYVNMHKNELCIIGVAKTHSMFAANRTVTDVCYKLDCSDVTGKKKKGAVKCEQSSVLAVVTCNDGTEWAVKAVVPSKLIEINPRVVEDPSLLQVHPFPMRFCCFRCSLPLLDKRKLRLLLTHLHSLVFVRLAADAAHRGLSCDRAPTA